MSTSKGTCSVGGCDREFSCRGLCGLHYQRWRIHGSTEDPRRSPAELFWEKVDVRGPNECWPWMAYKLSCGYGRLTVRGQAFLAHRFAYELLIGPIPEGLELDHVKLRGCTSRACVNPAHLEPVTSTENKRRGEKGPRTHCPYGHPYAGDNLYVRPRGQRDCRECKRARDRLRRTTGKRLFA